MGKDLVLRWLEHPLVIIQLEVGEQLNQHKNRKKWNGRTSVEEVEKVVVAEVTTTTSLYISVSFLLRFVCGSSSRVF